MQGSERQLGRPLAADDVELFFGQHRIYFPTEVSKHFAPIQQALREAYATFAKDLPHQAGGAMPQTERDRRLEAWRRAKDVVTEVLPDLIEAIERSMRGVLAGDVESAPIRLGPVASEGKGGASAELQVIRGSAHDGEE